MSRVRAKEGVKSLAELLAQAKFLTPDSAKSTSTSLEKILNADTSKVLNKGADQSYFSSSDPLKHQYPVYPLALVKRTGVLAGRSVFVGTTRKGHVNTLSGSLSWLNQLNKANAVRKTLFRQRFHERPGKTRLRLKNEKKQRDFNKGIKRLFELVNEAKRKGY